MEETRPTSARRRWWLGASLALNAFLLLCVLGLAYGWPLFIHVRQVLPKRERRVSFFAEFPVTEQDVVFVGDALVDEARWSELFPNVAVKNRGVAGDTTEDVALRIGQIAAGRPSKVFLMVGGGDAAAEKTVEETAASYRTILDRLRTESPTTEVFVLSILPTSPGAWEDVQKRNEAIRGVAVAAGATYIDLAPLFAGDDGGIRTGLSNDHAHLLGPGYEVWRRAIAAYVGGADGGR